MSGEHSRLAPSSGQRWSKCPGSVVLEACFPETESSAAALEGEAGHWVCSESLADHDVQVGCSAPNGVAVNDEMIEGAEMYVAAIDEQLLGAGLTRSDLHIEERINISRIHPTDCWGTPDCWHFSLEHFVLNVTDYKFGHGYVDVFENVQLILYVAGLLDLLRINGLDDQRLRVRMTIVQPRCYHSAGPVRTWEVMAVDLRAWFNILRSAATKALSGAPDCVPNPECIYCNGRHACPALQVDAYRSADIATKSLPVEMPPEAVGLELHYLRNAMTRLKARMTGLEGQAVSLLQRGQRVPFSALENSAGRLEWTKPDDEIITLGQLLGQNLTKTTLLTPVQAVEKGVPEAVVTAYAARKKTWKLVADDGREARRVFGK